MIARARGEDTEGRRRDLIRDVLFEELGVAAVDPIFGGARRRTVTWRGTPRDVDVVFGNVRDTSYLPDDAFRAQPGTVKLVLDYPFDEPGHRVREDDQRLEDLRNAGLNTHTIAWLPHFLSDRRVRELGRLVILDWLLTGTGDRWQSMPTDLAQADRAQASTILENQRTPSARPSTARCKKPTARDRPPRATPSSKRHTTRCSAR